MTDRSIDISNKLAKISGLNRHLLIPERTRSLLWLTDESLPNSGIVAFDPFSGKAIYGEGIVSMDNIDDIQAEPSLIWIQLPIEPNESKLPKQPYYFPTYRGLPPQQKFQYLNWLRDITQPTWLSFVFLYLYGLERHLVLGDYDAAVDEIKLLIKHHDIGGYAYNDLALASIIRGKNIFEKIPEIEENLFDPVWLRAYHKMSLTPAVVLRYASQVGFTNSRYIKQQPDLFNEKLHQAIDELENSMGGAFFSKFLLSGYDIRHLINNSLERYSKDLQIPSTQQDDVFEAVIYKLLDRAHTSVRLALHPNATVKKPNKTVMNSARKRELTKELDDAIERLSARYEPSAQIEDDESDSMPSTQFNRSLARLDKISTLTNLKPDEAISEARDLINTGYRTPAVYSALAVAYMKKDDYRTAFDILMQAKVDYGYDFKWQLRRILARFRSELDVAKKPSLRKVQLDDSIKTLVTDREKSSWAGLDKSLELSPAARRKLHEKSTKIWHLGKTNPEKSLNQALALFNDGYRTEFICKCIAAAYRRQQRYEDEVDFLIQLKQDFEYYDFDSTIRKALSLLDEGKV